MIPTGYLVQYGRCAYVGRFTTDRTFSRGDRAIVRSSRGIEIGIVLCDAGERFAGAIDPSAGGELLRLASPDDETTAVARDADGVTLLAAASESSLPLTFLDVEVMLDGSSAVLHALPWEPCDADPLFAELSARFGMPVRMLDLSRTPVAVDPPTTCGKPDCGSGNCSSCGTGGGCSTGSCSRGSVKSAAELSAYFADLRSKMEAAGRTSLA